MTAFARLRRAWPVTFAIHVFQALLAGTFAMPIALGVSYPEVAVREPVAAWISLRRLSAELGPDTARHALLPLGVAALNYPWLSVAWLRALETPEPFLVHARYALQRYRIACTLAVATVLALGLLVAAACGAAWLVADLAWNALDERGLDLAILAGIAPFAALTLIVVTLQDAAYAAVSRNAPSVRAALRAALRGVTARLIGLRFAFAFGQLALGAAAWLGARVSFGAGVWADLGVFAATQAAALLLTCSRALWLALVLAGAPPGVIPLGSESRAPRAAGSTPPTR